MWDDSSRGLGIYVASTLESRFGGISHNVLAARGRDVPARIQITQMEVQSRLYWLLLSRSGCSGYDLSTASTLSVHDLELNNLEPKAGNCARY